MKDIKFHMLIFLVLLAHIVSAFTIPVRKGTAQASIKAAIELAAPGDTIRVYDGIYAEGNIKISKPLTLIGINKPVIDGEFKWEVFSVTASHVTISGFVIRNSGISSMNDLAGIGGEHAHHLTVTNNEFIHTFFGVHLSGSNYPVIENNSLKAVERADHETGNGIHLWQCTRATIRNNTVQGHRDGIYFEFVTHSLIAGNRSEGNMRYGLHFMFSNDDEYIGNVFKNNGAGVAVMYTKNVTMIDNLFERNWGSAAYGLLLKDIRDSRVENNQFIHNTIAIFMEGSSRILFKRNQFSNNGWAVKLQASCDQNEFTENNFSGNTFDLATNGAVVLNTINRNYWDKYTGYDINKDGVGDIPFRPVSMYAMIVERIPTAVFLWRSFLVFLLDKAEKTIPAVTPENLKDDYPTIKAYDIRSKR